MKTYEVLPRFELGSLDSESRVLTITPQGRCGKRVINFGLNRALAFEAGFEPNPSVFFVLLGETNAGMRDMSNLAPSQISGVL